MSPYRTPAPPAPEKPSRALRCRVGLHKMSYFTVCNSTCFICQGMTVKFYCACEKLLGVKEAPTKRPVVLVVGSDWDGMGGSGALVET